MPDADAWARLDAAGRGEVATRIVLHGLRALGADERLELVREISARCGFGRDFLERSRALSLLDEDELAELAGRGLDLQLHTHSHWSPGIEALAKDELRENGRRIAAISGRTPRHFCYPSGRLDQWRTAWLAEEGVESATTTQPGLCRSDTDRFLLPRYLDFDTTPEVEFEAEMAGVGELIRKLAGLLRRRDAAASYWVDPAEEQRREHARAATRNTAGVPAR